MKFPIVVWDTEFTSWKGCNEVGWNPEKDEYKEIIQIGAVKIGSNGEIEDTFTSYCKPRYNTQLSSYIKELTGITQNDISNSDDLVDVWNEFEEWRGGIDAYSFGNDISVILYDIELYNEDIDVPIRDFYNSRELLRELNFPVSEYDSSGNIHQSIEHNYEIDTHNARDDALSVALVVTEYTD